MGRFFGCTAEGVATWLVCRSGVDECGDLASSLSSTLVGVGAPVDDVVWGGVDGNGNDSVAAGATFCGRCEWASAGGGDGMDVCVACGNDMLSAISSLTDAGKLSKNWVILSILSNAKPSCGGDEIDCCFNRWMSSAAGSLLFDVEVETAIGVSPSTANRSISNSRRIASRGSITFSC